MFVRSATRRTIVGWLILAAALTIFGGRKHLAAQPAADELPRSGEARDPTATDNTRIALPAIDVGNGWVTQVHVQNAGHQPTAAVLDFYSTLYPRLCPIKAGQNLVGTRCTGPIAPGTTWTLELTEGMELDEAKSAVVYSVVPGGQDAACGGNGSRAPGQPLAVTVTRIRTPTDGQPAASSAYTGIWHFDADRGSRYRAFAPWVAANSDQTHAIAIQNMGDECSTFQRYYFRQAFPGRALIEWLDIKPGAAVRITGDVIWFEPFIGSAWVRAAELSAGGNTPISPQPLAVVVDQWGEGEQELMTYAGVPGSFAAATSYAPLVYKGVGGWDTAFQVQNVGRWFRPITATVSFVDFGGASVGTASRRIEGWDSWRVSVRDEELPEAWLGTLRTHVEAAYAERDVSPKSLSVVSLVNKYGQAASYASLQPPPQGGAEVALPWLVKGYREYHGSVESTQTSRIALQNLNPNPGTTRFRIDFYGEDGVVGSLDGQIEAAQARLIDLREVDVLPAGFHGSAVVRLKETTQPGYAAIGAIVFETTEAVGNGDWSRAYEGIPLAASLVGFGHLYLPLIARGGQP